MTKGFAQFTEDLLVALVAASGNSENGSISALDIEMSAKLDFQP